jgi:hypothetical protein
VSSTGAQGCFGYPLFWGTTSSLLSREEVWALPLSDLRPILMAGELSRVAPVSSLKLKSSSGAVFPFSFPRSHDFRREKKLKKVFSKARGKKSWYTSLISRSLFIKILSSCQILKVANTCHINGKF